MRSQLPTLELDSVFEAKEELAVDVKNSLTETMTSYGYQIVQVSSLGSNNRICNVNLCSNLVCDRIILSKGAHHRY
jgi:hypothetical protein